MRTKDYSIFLKHILESIEQIEGYVEGITENEFRDNLEKQDAIIRRLEIIGEAVINIPEDFRNNHGSIEWKNAVGTRNILIHHYFGIDLGIVWDTVKNDLPILRKQINSLYQELISAKE